MNELEKHVDEYIAKKHLKRLYNENTVAFKELKKSLMEFAEQQTQYLSEHILELINDKGRLTDELKIVKEHSFNKNDMVDAMAYCLYYSVNPNSEMCVPNCAYLQADKMFKKWSDEKNREVTK